MKKITLSLSLLLFSMHCFAQTEKSNALTDAYSNSTATSEQQQTTENTFVPYFIKDDKTQNFEQVGGQLEYLSAPFGAGTKGYYTVFNSPSSTIRFKSGSVPKFIIKVSPGTDVFELVEIVKSDAKKGKAYRRFVKSGHSVAGQSDLSEWKIVPELKKISQDTYEISVIGLKPGEYSFTPIYKGSQSSSIRTTSGKYKLWCFAIDE